ncbi:hypothetical protein [Pseudomonas aeruginosa]|uniref:hypothetical protein n=1 Tax=Pseudomonas aeruginosa TaxID=287 RepID=UPI0013CE32D9|nr:hypothetical protein [Pseudomonas aeruginosa]
MEWPLFLHYIQIVLMLAFVCGGALLLLEHSHPPEPGERGFLSDAGMGLVAVACGISFISILALNWTPLDQLLIKAFYN